MLFQICPVCDMQQDIEPYDVCQVCGHEWSSEEIRSSTPVPIERPLTQRVPDGGDSLAETELSNDEMDDTFDII